MSKMCVLLATILVSAGVRAGNVYYVNPDPTKGSDSYDGTRAELEEGTIHGPKQTLQKAMEIEGLAEGDVVWAAEGTYDSKQKGVYRVWVPAGVTLKASGSRESTIIVGAAADGVETDVDPFGCGAGAVQCVYLAARARLVGFTVSGGCGTSWTDSIAGAGVTGSTQNGEDASVVMDCVITGCAAGRGAGLNTVTAVRCKVFGNRGKKMGAAAYYVDAYNCLFAGSLSADSLYDVQNARLFNCRVSSGSVHNSTVYNSYVYNDRGNNSFFYSTYSSKSGSETSTYGAGTLKTWQNAVDADQRPDPTPNAYYGINLGSLSAYEGLIPAINEDYLLASDYAGGQRVYNGQIDIGCGEYDPRGDFAAALSASDLLAVEQVSGGATLASSTVTIPAGEMMTTVWNISASLTKVCTFTLLASASETAVLSVYLDDAAEPLFTVTASDGEKTLSYEKVGANSLRFVVTGEGSTAVRAFTMDHANDYYVDAERGNDAWTGTADWEHRDETTDPVTGLRKTLQAMAGLYAANHGDVIHAAEGEYRDGSASSYRFCDGKGGVTLRASGARDRTFIIGKADDSGTQGCGSGALACVYLGAGSRLEGFTVCGGRAAGFTSSNYAAGIRGVDYSSLVVDCIISNCAAGRAAAIYNGTAVRCRFSGNRANTTGSDIMSCKAYNCYFAGSLSLNKYDVHSSVLYNCTMGKTVRVLNSTVYNSRVGADYGGSTYYRCSWATKYDETSSFLDDCYQSTAFTWDENLRPTTSTYIDVDRGNWALYEDAASGANLSFLQTDFAGGQRVYNNGKVDVGCGEYDWRGDFGAALGCRGEIAVVQSDPSVKIAGPRALSFAGGDGIALAWTWSDAIDRSFTVAGTATVTVDGVVATADDGVYTIPGEDGGTHDVRIVAASDADVVTISRFRRNSGMILLLR